MLSNYKLILPLANYLMNCPRCTSKFCVKAGFIQGKQRFKCNNCNFHFIDPSQKEQGLPLELKKRAIALVKEGKSIRQAARNVGTSHVSVLKWLKEFQEK